MTTNNTSKRRLFDSDYSKSTHRDFTAVKIFKNKGMKYFKYKLNTVICR